MISRNISSVFRLSLHTWIFLEKLHEIKKPFPDIISTQLGGAHKRLHNFLHIFPDVGSRKGPIETV